MIRINYIYTELVGFPNNTFIEHYIKTYFYDDMLSDRKFFSNTSSKIENSWLSKGYSNLNLNVSKYKTNLFKKI